MGFTEIPDSNHAKGHAYLTHYDAKCLKEERIAIGENCRYTSAFAPRGARRSRSCSRTFMQSSLKRLCSSPAFIVCTAFTLRMAILYLEWQRIPGLADIRGSYGYEAGRVARAIALGRSFSSPMLLVDTGPTAYLCPAYPSLLAGIFKVWGIYTVKSHIVAQIVNCALAALTILPIYAIAKHTFNARTAVFASWLWTILPNAWHIPITDVWDSTLSAFWFALIFWATLALRGRVRLIPWAAYGAVWAIGAMINATILSVLPFLFIWLIWDERKESARWLGSLGAALFVFILGISPWMIRNYQVFDTFIPMRSNFGLMLWVGNNPVSVGVDSFPLTVVWNQAESDRYKAIGEIAYMREKQNEAIAFIRSHPAQTLGNIVRRIGTNWFEVSDRPNNVWAADPWYLKALLIFNATMIGFSVLGVAMALRFRNPAARPYLFVMLAYPLVYYVTCALVRYRFPMEPILTILAVYGFGVTFRIWRSQWLSRSNSASFATPNAVQTRKNTNASRAVTSATNEIEIFPACDLSRSLAIPRFGIPCEKLSR